MSDDLDLTPDPAAEGGKGQETMSIEGVLAEGAEAGNVRLYLDLGFETYYDIPREAIVQRDRVPAERSLLGVDTSRLLVRRGTSLVVHRVATRPVEEEFLAGDFTAPGSFRAAGPLSVGRPESVRRIPSYTLYGAICCNPISEGCFSRSGVQDLGYRSAADTYGPWPTNGGHCTLMTPCIC